MPRHVMSPSRVSPMAPRFDHLLAGPSVPLDMHRKDDTTGDGCTLQEAIATKAPVDLYGKGAELRHETVAALRA